MMKKLLSLLLSVVMVMSLAVPAFADGPDGPPPDETVIISEDESASLGIIGGADGPTSILTTIDLEDWDLDSTLEELLQQYPNDLKEAYGGVAGQIGVMVNGKYVKFPDAAPEVTGGRTMVPVRALVETLGGEIDYQDGTVQFTVDGCEYEFAVGRTTVTVCAVDGGAAMKPIEMDCAPYVKGGRTYVPIRFISEALGYDVGWDGAYDTAVLLDREKLAADIDKNFSILNRVQAAANPALKAGESWSADMKGSLSVTAFDTVNGNKTYKADLTGNMLTNSKALNGTCSVTFSDKTVDALVQLAAGTVFGEGADKEMIERLRTVLTGLKDMEIIMNREGLVWFHAPLVDELSGEKNLWAAADMGAELGALMFAETDTATVGSALVSMLSGDSVAEMAALDWMSWFMNWMYSDEKFTTSDGVSTRTIGVDDLMALYEAMGIDPGEIEDEVKGIFKEYNITLKVDSKGGATVTEVMETSAQLGVPAVRMTADVTQDGQGATMTMKVHVSNLGEMELTLTTSRKAVSEAPRTQPPEDATIMKEAEALPAPEDHR